MYIHIHYNTQTVRTLAIYSHVCALLLFVTNLYRLTPREFNSYGARRGNDSVMARGTFANIRLVNKFMKKPGPKTLHFPSGEHINDCTCTSL